MSNKREVALTLSFELADLPMLASAIAIGRNEALMSNRPRQRDRLEAIRKQFDAAIPPAARAFGRYDFCDIVIAVGEGKPYEVRTERRDGWLSEHDVTVTVDGRTYKARDVPKDGHNAVAAAILAMLDEIAPLPRERGE